MVFVASPIMMGRGKKNESEEKDHYIDMSRVATVVLGGGQGTRLFPLTMSRCKPAICFGGRYRLIDVPVSNAINSGCHKIFIITQFLSTSLHRYISHTYNLDAFSSGFIDVLAVEEKPNEASWFEGTADAVRKNLEHFAETPADYFMILSGDQLYNMDLQDLLRCAKESGSDIVVATLPVTESDAKRMGIMQVNDKNLITAFHEKPKDLEVLKTLQTPYSQLQHLNIDPSSKRCYLGSMGIYIFKREALFDILQKYDGNDFGKDIIPIAVSQGRVTAYPYNGYWEDIGTIESFYNTNIALAQDKAPFDCYNEEQPIYTTRYNLPGPKIRNATIRDSIICEGAIVEADEVVNSILGPRTVVREKSVIRNSYVMGNDYYECPVEHSKRSAHEPQIGSHCVIEKTILDKNVSIGNGVRLINKQGLKEYDGKDVFIRDGIIIVTRGAEIPDGFTL